MMIVKFRKKFHVAMRNSTVTRELRRICEAQGKIYQNFSLIRLQVSSSYQFFMLAVGNGDGTDHQYPAKLNERISKKHHSGCQN